MIKRVILISLTIFLVVIFSASAFASASYLLKNYDFNITNVSCISSYKNVTVCEFDSQSSLITGLYENNTIFINRIDQYKDITIRHEYCHYIQDAIRNEPIEIKQELECYYTSLTMT